MSFCYVRYYIVSDMCIGGGFLEECFCCYSQQIISAVPSEFLIPYNLKNRTFNTVAPNSNSNQIKKNVKYSLALRTKDFVLHKYKQ